MLLCPSTILDNSGLHEIPAARHSPGRDSWVQADIARYAVTSDTMDLVQTVRSLVESHATKALSATKASISAELLMPGKMLRTRLAARLSAVNSSSRDPESLQAVCAATELAHTASLCHDDVMDNSLVRRSAPTLWRASSPSGAILIGDLLLCEAVTIMLATTSGQYLPAFVAKVTEVVQAEAQQELLYRGKPVDTETCMQLARGKTGPLFAFTAAVCGGDDGELCGLLEEAGYRIGTAYQLADDLMDVLGTEDAAGKTLGTDSARGKVTLPQVGDSGMQITRQRVSELCTSSVKLLSEYPEMQNALRDFFLLDLQPVLQPHLDVDMGIAV